MASTPTQPQTWEEIRTDRLKRYDFQGLVDYLQANDPENRLLIERYESLAKLRIWLEEQLAQTSESNPWKVREPGQPSAAIWQVQPGLIAMKKGDQFYQTKIQDLEPELMGRLIHQAVRERGAPLQLMRDGHFEAMRNFGKEYNLRPPQQSQERMEGRGPDAMDHRDPQSGPRHDSMPQNQNQERPEPEHGYRDQWRNDEPHDRRPDEMREDQRSREDRRERREPFRDRRSAPNESQDPYRSPPKPPPREANPD